MENTLPNRVDPVHVMKPYGGMMLGHHTFLTSAPGARKCSTSSPSHFTPRKNALGTYCIVGWVGRESKNDSSDIKSLTWSLCNVRLARCLKTFPPLIKPMCSSRSHRSATITAS